MHWASSTQINSSNCKSKDKLDRKMFSSRKEFINMISPFIWFGTIIGAFPIYPLETQKKLENESSEAKTENQILKRVNYSGKIMTYDEFIGNVICIMFYI